MYASTVLQKCLSEVFARMHAMRVRVLLGAVTALLRSRRLVLMELARAWPNATKIRAPLKRIDRLLSNTHLQAERNGMYAAMARWLVRSNQPLIVVDWSALKQDESWHVLRAGVVLNGRTLTLFEQIYSQRELGSRQAHRSFLRGLKALLPPNVQPIVLTDAGFRCPWFREVESLGWHWIGRVRNHVYVQLPSEKRWRFAHSLLVRARRLTVFGTVQLAKHQTFSCQMLRYCKPLRGRKRYTLKGRAAKRSEQGRGMREPWLLAYSTTLQSISATRIAACYAKRMQIEQSFRDLKSGRYGCALRYSLTRTVTRLSVLLLLHALACFVAWIYGLVACKHQETSHCDVRLDSPRPHYSILRIGWEALRRSLPSLLPINQLMRYLRHEHIIPTISI